MKTAVLVDGDFFLRRHYSHFGKAQASDPKKVAEYFWIHCIKHLNKDKDQLYRIYFYDCPPLHKKLHHPITNKAIDLGKSPTAIFRTAFHYENRFGYSHLSIQALGRKNRINSWG